MNKNVKNSEATARNRQKAEALLKKSPAKSFPQFSKAETLKLMHELEVHQIELEMQNEELVLAKEKAELAAEKHAALYDFAPSGYFTLSKEGQIIELNLSGALMLGKERMYLINKPLVSFFTSDTKPAYVSFADSIFKSQTKECCEVRLLSRSREAATVYLTGIASENGEQCFVTMVDISACKKIEGELRESESKLREAQNLSHIGVWNWIADTDTVTWTEELYRIAGRDLMLPAPTYKEHAGLYTAESWELLKTGVEKAMKTGEPYQFDLELIRPDGSNRNVKVFGGTKFDAMGKVDSLFGTVQDITERKQLEKALLDSEEKLRTIFETMTEGIALNECIFDEYGELYDYRILEVNKAFYSITGFREDMSVVGNVASVLYGTPHEMIKSFWESHKNQNFTVQSEYSSQDTPPKWYQISTSPYVNNRFVTSFFDITQQKTAENERRKYEHQLQQTQKLESLGVLAGGIAHDFNNLLGGIYGYIELAGEGAKDEKLSRYISKAMITIERARGLTLQLLTFAKGGAPIKKIGSLFPFIQETAQFALSGSNVSCTFDLQDDLYICNFDKNQIGQVIDNIVINAKQAMPDGGTIAVTARNVIIIENEHPLLTSGDYVKISIKDCGIGIPKNILPRIFEPFYTTKATGHGLGLASCYSIIKRHGGCIEVESEPGQGSTFHVYLLASKYGVSSGTEELPAVHKGIGTFLVMDDEEVMRETFQDMLELLGYSVVCTTNGKEAIDFILSELNAKREIAGMFFDLTIPGGIGGKEAIGEIRKMYTCMKTPVFVTSGYAEDPIMANPTVYGFTASICKPFRISELSEMLNKYMKPIE